MQNILMKPKINYQISYHHTSHAQTTVLHTLAKRFVHAFMQVHAFAHRRLSLHVQDQASTEWTEKP